MDFGEVPNDAMDKRLHIHYFNSLPDVGPDANQRLREHAMNCIVWAQRKATNVFSNTLTGDNSEVDQMGCKVKTFDKFYLSSTKTWQVLHSAVKVKVRTPQSHKRAKVTARTVHVRMMSTSFAASSKKQNRMD